MIFDNSPILANFSCQQAIDKTIICEDGVPRRVVEIVPSHAFPWMSIINENDPDSQSGWFVHNLDLAAQCLGEPRPDKDAKEAFIRMCQAMNYNEMKNRHERRTIERKMGKRKRSGLFLLK